MLASIAFFESFKGKKILKARVSANVNADDWVDFKF